MRSMLVTGTWSCMEVPFNDRTDTIADVIGNDAVETEKLPVDVGVVLSCSDDEVVFYSAQSHTSHSKRIDKSMSWHQLVLECCLLLVVEIAVGLVS